MIRPRRNGRRNPALRHTAGKAGVDNRQLVAAAVGAVEALLDLSLEPDFSLEPEPDFSLDVELLDPESLDEEPLLELDDFFADSRLSVR